MREAATKSNCILAVVTGLERPNDPVENAYFKRAYCVSELRWARQAGVPIQPIIDAADKGNIGKFLGYAPDDLKDLGQLVDFVHLDQSRPAYWKAGIEEVLRCSQNLVEASERKARLAAWTLKEGEAQRKAGEAAGHNRLTESNRPNML